MSEKTYKVLLLGEANSGKTTLVRRLLRGEFSYSYQPTLGASVNPLRFRVVSGTTNQVHDISLVLWDIAGEEKTRGLGEGYYFGADAAIICSAPDPNTSQQTKSISKWVTDFSRVCPNIPIILVSTKTDMCTNSVKEVPRCIRRHILVSSLTCYRIYDPFLTVAKVLLKDESLHLSQSS